VLYIYVVNQSTYSITKMLRLGPIYNTYKGCSQSCCSNVV